MKKLAGSIIFICIATLSIACSQGEQQASTGDLMLLYEDSEPGIDAFPTRLLVNDDFLRMDDGTDDSGYTLFDRQKKIIYSVSHENKMILKLVAKETKQRLQRKLVMNARKLEDSGMPDIDGKKAIHYQLTVNDKLCANVIAIKGLHVKAVRALNEFRRVMVNVHLKNLANTPVEMQDECFLAHYIASPSRTLQFGLPVLEQDVRGLSRLLIDYKDNMKVNPLIYTLPEGYEYTSKGS